MHLYRFWASAEGTARDRTGRELFLKKWAGSNTSEAEALANAEAAVHATAALVATRNVREPVRGYSYDVRGVPEEIIGEPDAEIGLTRNRMGCVVVNAARAMFVDVDLKPESVGFISRLFGAKPKDPEAEAIKRLRAWVGSHPGSGVRVYRTAGGLRYLFTHAPTPPDAAALACMTELGADPLYVTLCRTQECFRARLTPKPWRIGVEMIPCDYPRATPAIEAMFREWLADYDQKATGFATCHLLEVVGNRDAAPELQSVIEGHDSYCRVETNLPLA